MNGLVLDTGPLRHFASEGWLRALEFIAGGRQIIIPESVERELRHQAGQLPLLNGVLDADWIIKDRSTDLPFLMAFARYEERLAVGTVNRGECGVLALGKVRGYEVVIDDATARKLPTRTEFNARRLFLCCVRRYVQVNSLSPRSKKSPTT